MKSAIAQGQAVEMQIGIDISGTAVATTTYGYEPDTGRLTSIDSVNSVGQGVVLQDLDHARYDVGNLWTRTDNSGAIAIIESLSFGAWGQRRYAIDWKELNTSNLLVDLGPDFDVHDSSTQTTRGYTSHEMLDATSIIHMNGRIYDPFIGRFLQADPFIQFPKSAQSLNRYSYVLNNPLSYNDPSGYFLGLIGNVP